MTADAGPPFAGFPVGWQELTQPGKARVAAIETFGSARLTPEKLKRFLGPSLDKWIALGLKNDPSEPKFITQLSYRLFTTFHFAYVGWSITQFYDEADYPIYITLDLVEPRDVGRRMPFKSSPSGHPKDPAGLIRAWQEYDAIVTGDKATDRDPTSPPSARSCASFFCLHGHADSRLEKYQPVFLIGVARYWSQIRQVAAEDSSSANRRAATYLMAYSADSTKIVDELRQRLHDPSDSVREAALMVLRSMSRRPDIFIPVSTVLPVLHYPKETERVLAAFTLYNLIEQSELARVEVRDASLDDCIALSRTGEPRAKTIALKILRLISIQIPERN